MTCPQSSDQRKFSLYHWS